MDLDNPAVGDAPTASRPRRGGMERISRRGTRMHDGQVTIDRRRATEERRLRSIIEQLADGIVIVGGDGLIRFANPAAGQLFARSPTELVGSEFGFAIAGGAPAEIDVVRRDGAPVTAELRVVDMSWEGEPACLVSVRDVTDRRRAEERARQIERERAARAEAEAANHAKSEFLATMSHELRTPLNAVIGYAQLLDLGIGGSLAADQQRHVDRILASSQHLLGLVNEVLDLAKIDAGRLAVHVAPTSAARTADAAAALVQPSAEAHGVRFAARPADELPVYYAGDEDRVRQILVNLLANAVKFTSAGGSVSLEYGTSARPDPGARLHPGGRWAVFRVSDTGIGIPADQLSRIFEPFVQVNSGHTRANEGSGLGLAISRRLARLMLGDITVRSTVGAGSVFTLWLPAADTDELEPRPAAVPPTDARTRPHGLADVGEILMRELQSLLEAFVTRLRVECPAPGVAGLKFSQLADHVAGYVADLAGMLIALDEAEGAPSGLLADAADIHRLVAGRHGAQRARLGWSEAAVRCEYHVLGDEIERLVRRRGAALPDSAVDEAVAVTTRLIRQAEQASVRAFARVTSAEENRRRARAGG
jgi:signal transduction histidine kinase